MASLESENTEGAGEAGDDDGGLGEDVQEAISDAVGGMKSWVTGFVWGLFKDLYRGLYYIPILMVAVIGFLFLGEDLALTREVEGVPGLADIPVLVSTWIIEATAGIGEAILALIWNINVTIVNAITSGTGVAAAPLLVVFQMVELGVLFYLVWAGARMASSLPGISTLTAAANVATAPIRRLVR